MIPASVPVFPLPNVVLFPKALLPLRIFEPRYRSMLQDVLDTHGHIAMALFKPGWETAYFGSPEVFSVVGVGRILDYRPADAGTYQVVLLGESRAEIQGWVKDEPYRVARVEALEEREPPPPEREGLRERIRGYLRRLTRKEKQVDERARAEIDAAISSADELGFLVDSIAYHYLSDPREKQVILEALGALERERLLREFLLRHELIPSPLQNQPPQDRPPRDPEEPSSGPGGGGNV